MTLYLAKKGDAWLKDEDELDDILRRGRQDSAEHLFVEMLSSWKLNKADNFEPGEEEIHILVELRAIFSWQLQVGMDSDAERVIDPYKQVAMRLKDDPMVSQLVDAVHYVAADPDARPFIVLESSSGMGKTQMAFNLMARDDLEVFYFVCERQYDPEQSPRHDVYTAFSARCETFLKCIAGDLHYESYESLSRLFPGFADGDVLDAPTGLCLQTFEFICALLSGAEATQGTACSYEKVAELLKGRKKQPVIEFEGGGPHS